MREMGNFYRFPITIPSLYFQFISVSFFFFVFYLCAQKTLEIDVSPVKSLEMWLLIIIIMTIFVVGQKQLQNAHTNKLWYSIVDYNINAKWMP